MSQAQVLQVKEEKKEMVGKDLGSVLKAARQKAQLTLKQVAKQVGLTPTAIVNWEANVTTPDAQYFTHLIELYQVSMFEVLNIEPATAPYCVKGNRRKFSTLGQRMEYVRVQKNLSKNEASLLLKVANTTLGAWEQGKSLPNIKALLNFAMTFEVPLEFLLKGEAEYIKPMPKRTLKRVAIPTREELEANGEAFAKQLRIRRKRENLSQQQLAQRLKIAAVVVYNWETGRTLPSPASLARVLMFFGLPFKDFIRDETTMTPKQKAKKGQAEVKEMPKPLAVIDHTSATQLTKMKEVMTPEHQSIMDEVMNTQMPLKDMIQTVVQSSQELFMKDIQACITDWEAQNVSQTPVYTEEEQALMRRIQQLGETEKGMLQSYLDYLLSKN